MFLQMGSPLPPINLKTWLRGEPIAHFQSNEMYVVGCSATRHPMQLQESFKDSCLEVIGAKVHERTLTSVEARAKPDAVEAKVVELELPDSARLHRRNGKALAGCQLFCRSSDLVSDRSRWPYSLYRSPDRTR